jgi:hypothetical protein
MSLLTEVKDLQEAISLASSPSVKDTLRKVLDAKLMDMVTPPKNDPHSNGDDEKRENPYIINGYKRPSLSVSLKSLKNVCQTCEGKGHDSSVCPSIPPRVVMS